MIYVYHKDELYHHGILGQKWGKRNGPPYPLSGGDFSYLENKYRKTKKKASTHDVYNKKHHDSKIKKGTNIRTLSYDKDRTSGKEMYYAATNNVDKHLYNAMFNKKIEDIGEAKYKYKIDNQAAEDINVASEDSASELFAGLYGKDRDFYNFVLDKNRMQSYFNKDKFKFRGYRESLQALDKARNGKPNSDDLRTIYRMFNYVIPYDGEGDTRKQKDMEKQRKKFFDICKQKGYGALLDTNDAIYGSFKAKQPVIVIDPDKFVLQGFKDTKLTDKMVSSLALIGFKALGG